MPIKDKIKIAFVCIEDSDDLTKSSGTTHFLKKAISLPEVEVVVIDKLYQKKTFDVIIKQIIGKLIGKNFFPLRSKKVLKKIASEIETKLFNEDIDFILASSSLPITYLNTKIPIFFYTDATFHSMLDFYFPIKKLSKETIKEGDKHEQLAINRATGIFYSSHWAANDAISYYNAEKDKVKVVLQGSNVSNYLSLDEVNERINKRLENKTINILFIGVDWERKGGDTTIETTQLLQRAGYKIRLDIVGIKKIPLKIIPNYCINHGFINKNSEEGQILLSKLYLNADFLFVPSKQECMAIVFAEANAYGLPSITTNVGGNPTIIENEKNGFIFNLDTNPDTLMNAIISTKSDKIKYREMSLNAYNKSINETNWDIVGVKIINSIKSKLITQ